MKIEPLYGIEKVYWNWLYIINIVLKHMYLLHNGPTTIYFISMYNFINMLYFLMVLFYL